MTNVWLVGRVFLEETLESQLDFVQATTSLAWQRLAATVEDPGYSAADVQHDSLHAAHVSAAFVQRRLLSHLRAYPWRLVQGNIEANIRRLPHADANWDPGLSNKLKDLYVMGHPIALLVLGVRLLSALFFWDDVFRTGSRQPRSHP